MTECATGDTTVRKRRIVVLISGSGSNLQSFIEACADGSLNADIVAVISNKAGVKGLERAADVGIPNITLDHNSFESRGDFDLALGDVIDSFSPDLIILAGFMRILTPHFVNRFIGQLMNIHPSLLPKYPGLHTHQRAIDAGDSEAGATVHFVTPELDGGPTIVQARVPVLKSDSAEVLASRILTYEHQIYPLAAEWFCQGRLELRDGQVIFDQELLPAEGVHLEIRDKT
jgi:phosphoribosylglycinamide formyltransferase-1